MPYTLSVVVTGRNDNHGGNLLRRMNIFVNCVVGLANRYYVPTELILVDWNPPADKPKLNRVLHVAAGNSFCSVRIIEVPPELHARYRYARRLPLYQMIGKNVGIRRARGAFVLATNIDLVFSEELFQFFSLGRLEKGRLYRVARYDVEENIPEEAGLDEWLRYCREHIIRFNHKRGSINLATGDYHSIYPDDIDLNPDSWDTTPLFTNACGDFQLMSREDWDTLCGYQEWDMFSMHLDSVFEMYAHHMGVAETILGEPYRVYHIEHQSGWTPEAQKSGRFEQEFGDETLHKLSEEEFKETIGKIMAGRAAELRNGPDWGLVQEALVETTL